jgi:DNA-binding transcriptional regulator YiaG
MKADPVQLAEEYGVPYWRVLHQQALCDARRLRGNRRHFLPSRPLLDIMRRSGMDQATFAQRCGVNKWTVYRWARTHIVEVHTADKVATRLNDHPAAIWGADWNAVAAVMDGVNMHRRTA